MARIEVRSFACLLESTWGRLPRRREARRRRESDEVAFFMALLPLDTGGSDRWTDWVYAPENRSFRIRSNDDVDSGEEHGWQYPVAFDIEAPPNRIFELILQIYEVDGGTETATQAQRIHDNLRRNIDEDYRPGIGMGSSPSALGGSGPTSYETAFRYGGHGGNDDLMFADVWHLDPTRPTEPFDVPSIASGGPGRIDPDLQIAEQRSQLDVEVEVSRFPPRADEVVERREYASSREDARYRFDVHYSA